MMRNKLGCILVLCLIACSPPPPVQPATDSMALEEIVREYFRRLAAYDYAGMRAMATPTFETLDRGLRLTHPELEDYIHNTAEASGAVIDFEWSQFNTKIVGDVAYTTFAMAFGGETFLDEIILRRTEEGTWLIDQFIHMDVKYDPEPIVRRFFHHMKAYNYDGMRAMITPGFGIVYDGVRLDWEGFEQRHRAEEDRLGAAASQPERFLYQLSGFNINETPDIVYVNFRATNPETLQEQDEEVPVFNTESLNSFILRRSGSRWLVEFIGSLPEPVGAED